MTNVSEVIMSGNGGGLTRSGYLETSSRPDGTELIPSKSLPSPTLFPLLDYDDKQWR